VPCIGQFHKLLLIINLGAHLLIIVITLDFSCFNLGFKLLSLSLFLYWALGGTWETFAIGENNIPPQNNNNNNNNNSKNSKRHKGKKKT